ncbi:MAG: LLM class flavin-dependent oxidoreductase [Tepidisphaera sp.]|nr:LLM class flavin-dependent oxidoreductase [Tepidisphaera sp.]
MSTRIGLWLPIFGAWLRNVPDEGMDWNFDYNKRVAQLADELDFETLLVAELNLNDIKGHDAPVLECWTTIAALAAVTRRVRLMAAIRPGFRLPAIVAKMASNIDHISQGRFELNLVSAWWKEEMQMYTGAWLDHTQRYQRSAEFARVLKGMWSQPVFNFDGAFYKNQAAVLSPKPVQRPGPPIWAGGESDEGREMIARECDGYLMHGDTPEAIGTLIDDMRRRRERLGLAPLKFGMAAYVISRETEREAQQELARITNVHADAKSYETYKAFVSGSKLRTNISLEDYSVSNRGLRPKFVGTPTQIAERVAEYARLGIDLVLAQCSPMHDEVRNIGENLLPLLPGHANAATMAGAK